jgi:hypothetical protein
MRLESVSLPGLGAGSALIFLLLAGCAQPSVTRDTALVDPEMTGKDLGGTDDIYEASQLAISSFATCERLRNHPGRRVILGKIINQTTLSNYDEHIVYNNFLDKLINAGSDKYTFLSREEVVGERDLQTSGQVSGGENVKQFAGADIVLNIEIRQLSGAKTDTLQYTFRLTTVNGEILCQKAHEVKKKR